MFSSEKKNKKKKRKILTKTSLERRNCSSFILRSMLHHRSLFTAFYDRRNRREAKGKGKEAQDPLPSPADGETTTMRAVAFIKFLRHYRENTTQPVIST